MTSGADSGSGSFRAAVAAANGDPSINKIEFDRGIFVDLQTEVVYTGVQKLKIDGKGATVSGAAGDAAANETWDGGLFVSQSAADLDLKDISFIDSFNNGVAVFLPAGSGDLKVKLDRVTINRAQFHGLLVDGQSTTGYNTDDVIHPLCEDPHPFDADGTIEIDIKRTTVVDSGALDPSFDTSILTGCPQDFDGVRVDQGGPGDIEASVKHTSLSDNFDEGLDLDEAGEGDVELDVKQTIADGNVDEGIKADEENGGDLEVKISNTSSSDSQNDDGVSFGETGDGDVEADIKNSHFDRNDGDGLNIGHEDAGTLDIEVKNSTTTSNGGRGIDAEQTGDDAGSTLDVKNSDLSGNDDDPIRIRGDITVTLKNVIE